MTAQEFDSFRLRTLAKTNGKNVHDLPSLFVYMKRAVLSLSNGEDVDFSKQIIDLGRKKIQKILRE
jgi:hypothetical protein